MSGYTTVTAHDGHAFRSYIEQAPPGERRGSLVLLHEIFGINHYMRTMAQEFAAAGYTSIVPDLFARQERDVELGTEGADFEHAIALRDALDYHAVVRDIAAAVDSLRDRAPDNNVGVLGYCLGGGLAFLAASQLDVDCAVSYYGVGVQQRIELARDVRCPVLFHFAEHDHYCPPEARDLIVSAFAENPRAETYTYPGVGHAFATYGRDTFVESATALAWHRTTDFLRRTL